MYDNVFNFPYDRVPRSFCPKFSLLGGCEWHACATHIQSNGILEFSHASNMVDLRSPEWHILKMESQAFIIAEHDPVLYITDV